MSVQLDMDATLRDGVKAGAIGGGGIIARLLSESKSVEWAELAAKTVSAIIVTFAANYYLVEKLESNGQRALACALVGIGTPEIIGFAIRLLKAKGEGFVAKAEKEARIKRSKRKGGKRAKR